MKQTKRILSMVLCLLMMVAVVPVMEASAATFSPRLSAPERSGYYGTQNSYNPFRTNSSAGNGNCTWYAWGRAYELLGSRPQLSTGNANTWYPRNVSSGAYPYGSTPKLGAIACWATGSAGHVAVVEAINGDGTITISESSWNATSWWFRTNTIKSNCSYYSAFQGFIYIRDFEPVPTYTEPPTAPVVSVDKKIGLINEDITIRFSSKRASNYWIGIYSDGVLWTDAVVYDNSYTINYAYVGKYDIAVVARNNCGSADGYASFRLGKEGDYQPTNFTAFCNKKTVLKNTDITFSFSADDATSYWFGISKNGEWIVRENIEGNNYTYRCLSAGDYQAAIVAMNPCSSAETKYIDFSVVESAAAPTVPTVSVSKKVALIDEEVEITFNSENANNYWIGIYKDDVLFNDSVVTSNSYTISYPWVGTYDVAVVARNDGGSASGYTSFKVGKEGDYVPQHVSASCDKSVLLRNEPVTITFSADLADDYWFGIYKDGEWIVRENLKGNTYIGRFDSIGEYSVAIVAMNACSSAETKYLKFSVVDKKIFSISYNAEGGYSVPLEQSKVYGKDILISDQVPGKVGYVFSEWNTKIDGTGKSYCPNATYSDNADLQLHAVWSPCVHTWDGGEETKAATCVATGVKTYTCTVCNATKTETIAVNASNHVNTTNTAATASTCTVKGYTAGVYCNDCKKYISGHTEQPLAPHTLTTKNAKAATCTAEGYTGDQYCTICQQTISQGTAIAKKAHTLTTINQKAANCTEAGYTGDQYCTTCKQTVTKGSVVAALGHTSPDSNGNCTRCGQHIKDVTPSQPSNPQPNPNACKYCGKVHTGPFGWLIKFFHSILAIFKR